MTQHGAQLERLRARLHDRVLLGEEELLGEAQLRESLRYFGRPIQTGAAAD